MLNNCLGNTARSMSTSLQRPWHTPHLSAGSIQPVVDPAKLTLYNMRLCPWAERTVLVLLAKKLPFVNININLRNKPEWFKETTLGQVPVIMYQGHTIPESIVNSDYLDEKFPEIRLLPSTPELRAENMIILNNMAKNITSHRTLFNFVGLPGFTPTAEDRAKALKATLIDLTKLNNVLNKRGHTFFDGEQPMMLDLMLWPFIERIEMFPLLFPDEVIDYQQQYNSLTKIILWVEAMKEVDYIDQYRIRPEIHEEWAKVYFIENDFDYDAFIQKNGNSIVQYIDSKFYRSCTFHKSVFLY